MITFVKYIESFGVEYIPKENKKLIGNKNFVTNIYIIIAYDIMICGYFCIRLFKFIFTDKSLTKFANYFHITTLKVMIK